MRRRYWFAVLAVLVLAVAIDGVYWRIAAGRLRSGWQEWAAGQRAKGWSVNAADASIGGWPFAAEVSLSSPALRHPAGAVPGQVAWSAGGVLLSVALFEPTALRIAVTGQQDIAIGDLPPARVVAGAMTVSVPLLARNSQAIDFHSEALRLMNGTGQVSVGSLNLHAEMVGATESASQAVAFKATAEAVTLPDGVKWPLGPTISSLHLAGKLNGPLPAAGGVTGWADAWRDGGGSLDVRHLAVVWGPLNLNCSATLALDEQLQPMGSGSAKVSGYGEALDRLGAAGILTKSAATVAKAVLSLLAGTGDGDVPSSVDVPLTLQYRTLSMRQVPLVRLPELDWPAR